jgi:hypothetical protein
MAKSPSTSKSRKNCLEKLFLEGCYEVQPDDDESTINMAKRYADIEEAFPDEIKGKAFPYFLDWLKYNVIFVEITAYSDDNAYAIFESMNDRGLNLTSTEMLKGYILSRFGEPKDREKANRFWKDSSFSVRNDGAAGDRLSHRQRDARHSTGMKAHQKIQIPFELHGQDVKFVGFWSSQHQGVRFRVMCRVSNWRKA